MSHYKPYPAYKDSGVEWLGRVPEHWEVMAIKHVVSTPITDGPHETPTFIDEGVPFVSAEAVSSGIIDFKKIRGFISEGEHRRYAQKYLPKKGDIYMVKSGATTGITAIVDTDIEFNIWSPLAAIRCGVRSLPLFVLNYMRSRCFQEAIALSWSYGTQQNIGMGVIGDLAVAVPPYHEQIKIAAHLEVETKRIDELLLKKTRFIELLREKRQALITHAATKGLDPTVKMKDSGVDWIGKVPEHWVVKRLRLIASVQTGIAKGKDNADKVTIEVPYLRVANVQDGYLNLDEVATINIPAEDLGRYLLQKGDVLMNEGGDFDKLGRGHIWHGEVEQCIHQNHVFAVRPTHVQPQWLNTFTSSRAAQFYFMGRAKQSTNLASISSTNLMELPVPAPPDAEQIEILMALTQMTSRLDTLITKTELSLTLLKERRSALITAAVTGQIDLREAS